MTSHDGDAFAARTRQVLALTADVGKTGKVFELGMFLWLASVGNQFPEVRSAIAAGCECLPPEYFALTQDSSKLQAILKASEADMKTWWPVNTIWPYSGYANTWSLAEKELRDCCIQTMREGMYVQNSSVATQRQFLADEKLRISCGLYPQTLLPDLQREHSKLERLAKKNEEEYAKAGQGGEAKGVGLLIAPTALPELMGQLEQAAAQFGERMPIPFEPLSEWEQQQFAALLAGDGNPQEQFNFLRTRWEALNEHMKIVGPQWMASQLYTALATVCAMAYHVVTIKLNFLGRRIYGHTHNDVAYLPEPFFRITRQGFEKTDTEAAKAFFPEGRSLFSLEYALLKEQAKQTQAQVQGR